MLTANLKDCSMSERLTELWRLKKLLLFLFLKTIEHRIEGWHV